MSKPRSKQTRPRNSPSKGTRRHVHMRDGLRCSWCKSPFRLTLEHIVPWSEGGNNGRDNLCILCDWCNSASAKGSHDVGVKFGPHLFPRPRNTNSLYNIKGKYSPLPPEFMTQDEVISWQRGIILSNLSLPVLPFGKSWGEDDRNRELEQSDIDVLRQHFMKEAA